MLFRFSRFSGTVTVALLSLLIVIFIWREQAHGWTQELTAYPFNGTPLGFFLAPSPPKAGWHGPDHDLLCSMFPDPGNIAIAVKTGATEAVDKIPMLMHSSLRCAQNVQIFSDLDQEIAGHHLIDALGDVSEAEMEDNTDFDFYWKLKEAQNLGQIEKLLKDYHDPRIQTDLAAWTLDKYKQLHVLEKLYEAYPKKDWYIMIDADTYLVWPTVLMWLEQLPNPNNNKLYLGSPAVVGDTQFAHGGSGIFLSAATMHEFAVVNNGTAAKWNKAMHDECCGDYIIGQELKQSGIILKPSWPTVNGRKPIDLPFGPTHWCQPVVTMHHVQPYEMNQLGNFELSRPDIQKPLTFAALYDGFLENKIPDSFEDWDSDCGDVVAEVDSYETCQVLCEEDSECFQFAHRGNRCTLSHSIHLGGPKAAEDGHRWRSGWLAKRINDWVSNQAPCEPEFPWT